MAVLIAEIGQAHEGSLGMAHSYIDALANSGVDVIKFQTHIAAAESSSHEPFRVKFSKQDASRFDYWKRMEFTESQWRELKDHCEQAGIEFLSSPFSIAAVALLEGIGVTRYKIGSGELSNLLMMERIAKTQKPVIISSGMSNWDEIDQAIAFFKAHNTDISLLQCTTAYPAAAASWGLGNIAVMKQRYAIPVGFSDHSGTPVACLAAAALGAEILEFHAVFDKRMFGPDANASLTIDEIKFLAEGVQLIELGLQENYLKQQNESFAELRKMFGKSLAVNKDMKAGETIRMEDLESKKPAGMGIDAAEFGHVLNRQLRQDKMQWDFLSWNDMV